jgi:hypothetical protein
VHASGGPLLCQGGSDYSAVSVDKVDHNFRKDRHYPGDIINLGVALSHATPGKLREVHLDYVWCVDSHYATSISAKFFESTLPEIASLLSVDGRIMLPMKPFFFVSVMRAAASALSGNYHLGYVMALEPLLVTATNCIPVDHQALMGRPRNEECILGFDRIQLTQYPYSEKDGIAFKRHVLRMFDEFGVGDYQFITLTKQTESEDSSTFDLLD